nr:hypothetical protein [Dechloromonas sp.]
MPDTVNHLSPAQLAAHVRNLQAIGDRLEAAGDPDWLPIAQAAMLLVGLQHHFVEVRHGRH